MNKTQINNQEPSVASDFEFSCKPLLGPSPELMQPNPASGSFREALYEGVRKFFGCPQLNGNIFRVNRKKTF